ncbi:hypothetical protein [Leifsonia sp. NPDC080035]|uniref:Uncharacterized protein n=1 Tax=Leifsonia sp. NPDC080035 TaxID=3143936 RepID=A0AAU7GAU5_9MICO
MPTREYAHVDPGVASRLPAGPILMRLRRVLLSAAAAAFVYTALGNGSRMECVGGGDTQPGTCVGLSVHPGWPVYAALAVILFVAIGRVARRASTTPEALRILDRAAILMIAIVLVSVVVGTVWMFLVPLDAVHETRTVIFPFPFLSGEVTFTPAP